MNRSSFAALALLSSFVTLVGSGCSSDDPTQPFPTAGTGQTAAGTGAMPMAGTSAGGSGTAGTPATAGTGGAAAGAAGSAAGGGGAAGAAGAATGGGGAAGAAGTAGAATGGGGAGGGSGMCPASISSTTPCTAAVSCPGTLCGIHKLGSRTCSCAAAAGMFDCGACAYAGGEEITVKPVTPLENCAMMDSAMEDIVGCTKGARCKSLDTTRSRFCACWDVAGTPKYDCDSTPSAWN